MRINSFNRGIIALVLFVFAALAATANGQQKLLVIGGGTRPPEAMRKFVEWSGGAKARILMITWATAEPEASFKAFRESLATLPTAAIENSPAAPLDAEKRAKFLSQLADATGVFFSGGDQNRIMDVLKDAELLNLIRSKYNAGTPFGGTSAGVAVMSDPMMTGDADLKILDGKKVGVRPGLGLIPNVMFDQHFLVRQRHNRLFGFVMKDPKYLGVGIDEDNSVLITDDRYLTVIGPTWVMFVKAGGQNGAMTVNFLKNGDRYDLRKRKPINVRAK